MNSSIAMQDPQCGANPLIDCVGRNPQSPRNLLRVQLLIDEQKTINLGLCQLFDNCLDLVCRQRWPRPIAQL